MADWDQNDGDAPDQRPFWERKSLREMSREEWESLCDGCGQCCRLKVCDADTGEVRATPFACRLLDLHSCRCSDYANRRKKVPSCLQLTPENVVELDWLPETCAYRRLADGLPLPEWHPLKTGDPDSVHRAGASVRGQLVSERAMKLLADDWEDWVSWQDEIAIGIEIGGHAEPGAGGGKPARRRARRDDAGPPGGGRHKGRR